MPGEQQNDEPQVQRMARMLLILNVLAPIAERWRKALAGDQRACECARDVACLLDLMVEMVPDMVAEATAFAQDLNATLTIVDVLMASGMMN
jgi:hypothetical protein